MVIKSLYFLDIVLIFPTEGNETYFFADSNNAGVSMAVLDISRSSWQILTQIACLYFLAHRIKISALLLVVRYMYSYLTLVISHPGCNVLIVIWLY